MNIAPAQLQLFFQRRLIADIFQAGTEQYRQVFHHLFGGVRVHRNQAGNNVHGIKQEMRADTRLQGLDARLQFCLPLLPQLLLYIEIAHDQAGNNRGNQAINGNFPGPQGARYKTSCDPAHDQSRHHTEYQGVDHHQQHHGHRRPRRRQPIQTGPQLADQCRRGQPHPLHKQGGNRQPAHAEIAVVRGHQVDHQGHQLGHHHHHQHRTGTAQVGQETGVGLVVRGRHRGSRQ